MMNDEYTISSKHRRVVFQRHSQHINQFSVIAKPLYTTCYAVCWICVPIISYSPLFYYFFFSKIYICEWVSEGIYMCCGWCVVSKFLCDKREIERERKGEERGEREREGEWYVYVILYGGVMYMYCEWVSDYQNFQVKQSSVLWLQEVFYQRVLNREALLVLN